MYIRFDIIANADLDAHKWKQRRALKFYGEDFIKYSQNIIILERENCNLHLFQMDQLQAWFCMTAYLIDRAGKPITNYFQSCQWSGALYFQKVLSFLVLLENCNLYYL